MPQALIHDKEKSVEGEEEEEQQLCFSHRCACMCLCVDATRYRSMTSLSIEAIELLIKCDLKVLFDDQKT